MSEEINQPIPENTQPQQTTPETVKPASSDTSSLIKKYKYPAIAILLLLLIIGIGIYATSDNTPQQAVMTPTPSVAAATPTQPIQAGVTMSSEVKTQVESQIKPELQKLITIDYTISNAKMYGDDWGILQVANPTTDPANIVVQKVNGIWTIKNGPGTSFDEAELRGIGAPESLILEVNSGI